jgi:cbb3-type cytochrome oxidase maturation protein
MDILFLLIPLSVVLVFVIGAVFWFALRGGQFEDLESPGLDVVLDDDKSPPLPAQSDVKHIAHEAGRKPQKSLSDS